MIKRVLSLVIVLMLLSLPALAAPSSWAEAEVTSAIKAGLVPERITDDYQKAITREEFCEAVMLLYANLGGSAPQTENPFSDTQNPSVAAAYGAKIVEGVGGGLFAPENNITRQEICTMLKRCIVSAKPETFMPSSFPNSFPDENSIADWAIDSVKYINMLEIMLGDEAARINPLQNTTREQAILLIYRLNSCFADTFDWISAYYGFMSSGNTPCNMLYGNFAITALDQTLYISDSRGISAVSEGSEPKLITSEKAAAIYPESDGTVYFIKESDSIVYCVKDGSIKPVTTQKADRFLLSGNILYFRGADDKAIYSVKTDGSEETRLTEGNCGMPIPAGNALYYSDTLGIVGKSINTGKSEYLYKGVVNDMSYENSTFFFKDENGYLYTLSNNTTSVSPVLLSSKPVEKYCLYGKAVLFVSEGSIYKRDLSKRFTIRIGDYNGESFNSYTKEIFVKDNSGKIYKLNPKTLEKTALN